MNLVKFTEVICESKGLQEVGTVWINIDRIEKIFKGGWQGRIYYTIHTGRTITSVANDDAMKKLLLTDHFEGIR